MHGCVRSNPDCGLAQSPGQPFELDLSSDCSKIRFPFRALRIPSAGMVGENEGD